jgi:hypothetical protein
VGSFESMAVMCASAPTSDALSPPRLVIVPTPYCGGYYPARPGGDSYARWPWLAMTRLKG